MAVHPVQTKSQYDRTPGQVSTLVSLRAYEVYKAVHGAQEALITGGCRGGFSTGELIAFLYASGFPRAEWSQRASEAFHDMRGL